MPYWRISTAALVATIAACIAQSPSSSPAYKSLGQPCRAKQVLGGTLVTDRTSGRELLALANMNEVSGGELLLIDVEKNSGSLHRMPAGAGSWNVREIPGDRLVIGTFYDGTFLIFDLKSKQFIHHVRFAKEEYLWNTALGLDGRIYSGTYPGGRLGALNLSNYTVEDCGAPAAPNLYLNTVSTTPDGRLLCSFSTAQPIQKLYNPATRAWTDVPESLKGVGIGATFNGRFVAGGRVFEGPQFTVVPPPFPTPGAGWHENAALSTSNWLYLHHQHAVYRVHNSSNTLEKLTDVNLRGGRYLAANDAGDLFGIRGQDYFRIPKGSTNLNLLAVPTESAPRNLLFLRIDPQGRLWSGPPFGQTLSFLDRHTGQFTNTRTVCDSGGEVFDVAFANNQVYAVAYSGGDIIAYDPAAQWDQWNGKNPRTLATIGPAGYVRPVGGALFGPHGKLYSGWMAKYGVYGGAIAVTDPNSGKTDLIENPLGEQTISGLATDGSSLFAGTDRTANGLPTKPNDSARFGVIDPTTKRTTFQHIFPGATRVFAVTHEPRSGDIFLAVDGALHRFVPTHPAAPEPIANSPRVSSRTLCAPGNGAVYYANGRSVQKLNLASNRSEPLATFPRTIENLAVAPDGALFASCGPELFELRDPNFQTPR